MGGGTSPVALNGEVSQPEREGPFPRHRHHLPLQPLRSSPPAPCKMATGPHAPRRGVPPPPPPLSAWKPAAPPLSPPPPDFGARNLSVPSRVGGPFPRCFEPRDSVEEVPARTPSPAAVDFAFWIVPGEANGGEGQPRGFGATCGLGDSCSPSSSTVVARVTLLPQGGGTSTSGFAASWGLPSPSCKHNRQVSHKKSSGGSFY